MSKWVVAIIVTVLCAILLRTLILDIYKVPSSSMEPSLLVGDVILVSKLNYGARIINLRKLIKQRKVDFLRLPGWSTVKKADVFVFNSHKINYFNEAVYNSRDIAVKRCFTPPGQFALIKDKNTTNHPNISFSSHNGLFPSCYRHTWSPDNYGPLYVPARDDLLELTSLNIQIYKHIILTEDPNIQIYDSVVKCNGKTISVYQFKQDYYFVLGDNLANSIDSRFWGFVSDKDIIGKVVLVLFSFDNTKKGLRKIRFNRFFKYVYI